MTVGELKMILNKRNDMDDVEVVIEIDNRYANAIYGVGGVTTVPSPYGAFVIINGCNVEEEEEEDEEAEDIAACERASLGDNWW